MDSGCGDSVIDVVVVVACSAIKSVRNGSQVVKANRFISMDKHDGQEEDEGRSSARHRERETIRQTAWTAVGQTVEK